MKLLAVLAIGAFALFGAATANAQEVCKVDPSHPRSPDCPTYPTELPVIEVDVVMEYPDCVIKHVNADEFPQAIGEGKLNYIMGYGGRDGVGFGSRSENHIQNIIHGLGDAPVRYSAPDYPIRGTSFYRLLQAVERDYGAYAAFHWHAETKYGDFSHYHWDDEAKNYHKWIRLRANISAHEFLTRARDCAERLKLERFNRFDRQLALEEFKEKQVALEQAQWALSEEIRLQQDLLKLTQSAIAAQNKADDAWRQLAEVRMAGLEARTALWQAYADGAAEESAQFFQQMQDRQDALNAAIAETEANLAKRDAVRQDIEALISDYEAKLAELDAKAAAAQAEAAQVNAEIEALRNAN